MSWAHPVIAAFVPVAIVAVWWLVRRAGAADGPAFANIHRRWADRRGLSDNPTRRRLLRGVWLAAGASAALLALARPQWGEIAEESYERSRDVILALDLSRSMLADDVTPSRLARAKLLSEALLDQLAGERVGLIVFAGTAFVQSPLSADYEVLRDFLGELDPTYLPQGGTNYTAMLRAGLDGFAQPGDGDRYLVVLSDGEALDEGWQELLPALRERGIRVIALGVGTPAGALVPDADGGLVKDAQGAAVLSRLEPRTLEALAAETGGTYRDAATWVDIAELVGATVEQGRQGEYVEQRNVRLQDRFQWFLAPALLFLLLSYWLEFPVSLLARALPRRGRRPHPASAPAFAAALMALVAWHAPRLASAAVPDTPPQSGTAGQPNPLTSTVAALSAKPLLDAPDYARLATDTIAFASQPSAPVDGARTGIVDDALVAVDRGEALDPRAADWPALRTQLEQLKQVQQPPPDPPQEQEQQPQNEPEQNGAQNEQNQQDQQGNGGGQSNQSGEGGQPQPSDDAQGAESGGNQQAEAGQDQEEKEEADSEPQSEPAADEQDGRQTGAGEVAHQDDVQPLAERDAGLGDQDQDATPPDAQPAAGLTAPEQAQQPPVSRLVGGGPALSGLAPQGDTALAEAIGAMERVKDGDAPAVLFDRMNRAEGQPRSEQHSKNW